VQFTVAANVDPVARTGGIAANGQRAEIRQAAAECRLELAEGSASFPQVGGSGTVQVRASSSLCTWTASSDATWIGLRGGSEGKGSAAVPFDVDPTTGPSRTGTIAVAGHRFTVTQSPGCSFSVSPASYHAGPAGGPGSIAVTAGAGCPWNAASESDWITVTGGSSGSGNGTVGFTVAPTSGPSRTGRLIVAGETISVTQGQACTFTIAPQVQNVPAGGGTGSVAVTAGQGCEWNAASHAPWITITSGASGSGNGAVAFSVAATAGPSRSGTLTVAGQPFTVTQGQGCSATLAPSSAAAPAAGSSGAFDVATADGCAWSASSGAPWISVTSGASGSGRGTVRYGVAANTGPARSGTIGAAGLTFTITQAGSCSFAVSPGSAVVPATSETYLYVNITTAADCAWTSSSSHDWISLITGASGVGSGTTKFWIGTNSGPARSGAVTVAGRPVHVTQEGGCTFAVDRDEFRIGDKGGDRDVDVSAGAGCAWTAVSHVPWIRITRGAAGTGRGEVEFTVDRYDGEDTRTGTLTIAGRTITVRQEGDD
jgi:hypothetical protein